MSSRARDCSKNYLRLSRRRRRRAGAASDFRGNAPGRLHVDWKLANPCWILSGNTCLAETSCRDARTPHGAFISVCSSGNRHAAHCCDESRALRPRQRAEKVQPPDFDHAIRDPRSISPSAEFLRCLRCRLTERRAARPAQADGSASLMAEIRRGGFICEDCTRATHFGTSLCRVPQHTVRPESFP